MSFSLISQIAAYGAIGTALEATNVARSTLGIGISVTRPHVVNGVLRAGVAIDASLPLSQIASGAAKGLWRGAKLGAVTHFAGEQYEKSASQGPKKAALDIAAQYGATLATVNTLPVNQMDELIKIGSDIKGPYTGIKPTPASVGLTPEWVSPTKVRYTGPTPVRSALKLAGRNALHGTGRFANVLGGGARIIKTGAIGAAADYLVSESIGKALQNEDVADGIANTATNLLNISDAWAPVVSDNIQDYGQILDDEGSVGAIIATGEMVGTLHDINTERGLTPDYGDGVVDNAMEAAVFTDETFTKALGGGALANVAGAGAGGVVMLGGLLGGGTSYLVSGDWY